MTGSYALHDLREVGGSTGHRYVVTGTAAVITSVVIACGASAAAAGAPVARAQPMCRSGQYAAGISGNGTTGAVAVLVRIKHIRGPICRLNGMLQLAIRGADGAPATAVRGNPVKLRVRARLRRGAPVIREALWQNWCGNRQMSLLTASFGSVQAEVMISPPRCGNAASPSTLAPLAGWGQPQPLLDAAPANCGPPARSEAPGTGTMFGADPFWFGPYAAYDEIPQTIHIAADAPHTSHGWQVKTLWIVANHLSAPVEVRVRALSGDMRMWVRLGGSRLLQQSFLLDPAHPGAYHDPDVADFPSYAYFPKAACYVIEGSWPAGMSRVILGVGR